jgi:hypothetical protein
MDLANLKGISQILLRHGLPPSPTLLPKAVLRERRCHSNKFSLQPHLLTEKWQNYSKIEEGRKGLD